ncbi:MBL fold metallo-hydrolase [Cryptosporangium arvum]|uniref:Zn-dependent hydrolase, glyoxylase n=1 Tax=Cryptosporangium arvum DSM 44712 TaxID=927661 RepID=A0A010ZXY8_9ACTN|nr:MBL fold metallo-hydrolase [Cryptosporangium arvum]EXG82082.1 Zn-dependent hydrolase, glyoxylase [Cryptosporangium arvum DSM 44712]
MTPELLEVAPGVHAYVQPDGTWMINNTGVIVGPAGRALLIDTTSTEVRNRALLASAASVAPGGTWAAVNTHHHGDHTYGNWLLPSSTPIVGHALCREDVVAAGLVAAAVLTDPDYGHLEVRAPDVTFTGSMTLHLGSQVVELHEVGPAHTRGDLIVWLPETRVLFAGDIAFAGGQPFLAEGSLAGYPKALAAIRALDPEVLVPGHGPVCRGSDIPRLLDALGSYAAFVDEIARTGHTAGWTPLETALRHTDNPFAGWKDAERMVGNLHRAYSELDGQPLGTRLDLTTIWPDMTAFHGGPIRSRA